MELINLKMRVFWKRYKTLIKEIEGDTTIKRPCSQTRRTKSSNDWQQPKQSKQKQKTERITHSRLYCLKRHMVMA